MSRNRWALAAALAMGACATHDSTKQADGVEAMKRTKGQTVADFKVDAVYTDERGGVAGTRWVHQGHGMPVTILRIQSVPQVFLAFNTPPVSDRGEPHTGEHLLLGKGTKGKALSAEQDMSLVQSTAWTSQTDVCYSWSCAAGKETFFRSVEQYLDALLLPDYGDEEVRREVCHIGPVKDQTTGALSVDEKGTIYQEMTSAFEKRWNSYRELQKRLWGEDHPLSYSSGGEPSAVRACEPKHVHDFHAAHYHLASDTEMIVALPDSIPETEFLERLSQQMAAVDARPEMKSRAKTVHTIPPGRPQSDKSLVVVPYPNANEGDGGLAIVAWTPVPRTSQADRIAAETLLATLANGQTATLYKRLMDSATREVPVDAAEMSGTVDASKIDLSPYVAFDQVPPRSATKERMAETIGVIRNEIARVASLAEGSPELTAFNEKALVKLTEREKDLKKQLNSPPLFGHRLAGGFWLDHLRLLDEDASFERQVTLAPVFGKLRADMARGANPWKRVIAQFGLSQEPYAAVSVASKAELEKRSAEHAQRVQGYVADIVKRYGGDAQAAIAKFEAEYDAKTAELEAMEKSLPKPRLVADVPLVPDPSIRLEPMEVARVNGFRGVFDNMTFVETSLSIPVDRLLSEDDLPWLAILPQMLTQSGVVIDGKPVPYDRASEMRAKEIYALTAAYSMRPSKGRHELRITASGADLGEARRAIEWIELCLKHAWLAPENLPRLRDVVAQEIQATRGRLGGSEENWVNDPANAVRWQRNRVYLATSSIHARLFLLARCEWRLMDAPAGDDVAKVKAGLGEIAAAAGADVKATAAGVDALVAKWKGSNDSAAKWLVPIGQRIREMVGDMAPSTIAADLKTLTATCERDLATPAADAMQHLRLVVEWSVGQAPRRFVLTGSRANTDEVAPKLGSLLQGLEERWATHTESFTAPAAPLVDTRLREHETGEGAPLFHGLVHNAGTSGVFLLSAKAAGLDEVDDATLTGELAARVYGGSGSHALFMRTWGAGLAYSNGLAASAGDNRIRYYAERCPDLVQTISFVTDVVKASASLDDPYLAEYCVANAVAHSRESDQYEQRTRAAADDMADGDTPERVMRWRGAVLALKDRPDLWTAMKPRIGAMSGRVLPGVGPKRADVEDAVWLTIAPEPLLARWETYLAEHDAPGARVARIYGRDFWMVPAR